MGAVGAVLAIGGALGNVLKGEGQRKSNRAAAFAAEDNAKSLDEQAEFARQITDRKKKLFRRQSEIQFGDNVSRYAKAGVDISGTPLMALAFERLAAQEEFDAIELEGQQNINRARSAADNSRLQARGFINANKFNPLTTFLGAATSIASGVSTGRSLQRSPTTTKRAV